MDLMNLFGLTGKTLIPAAEEMTLSYVTAVVITGLSVVFLGLIILILFVWAFGKIFSRKKAEPAKAEEPAAVKPVAAVAPAASKADDNQDEVIVVISAAVAAMGASEGKTYKLRSVKAVKNKPSRSAWSMAGIQNDTTPF